MPFSLSTLMEMTKFLFPITFLGRFSALRQQAENKITNSLSAAKASDNERKKQRRGAVSVPGVDTPRRGAAWYAEQTSR